MHEQWAEKFWDRVRKSDTPGSCWEWTGSTLPRGYGRFYPQWKVGVYAHRVSWEMANNREVPAGLVVMHSCDNPRCVNPSHLDIGTYSDNALDAVGKGRATPPPPMPGERHPAAKLTDAQVADIKQRLAAGANRLAIAVEYGVTKGAIKHIAAGRAWKHVVANELPPSLPYPRVSRAALDACPTNEGGSCVSPGV